VTVRINDRGPYVRGRCIDLSKAAADALGFTRNGLTRVRVAPAD
jgi:rare lipoprotein A